MGTPKQDKLVKLLMENYGITGDTKSLGELMLLAGYSEESAKNPKLIIDGDAVQEGLSDVIKTMEKERKRGLEALATKNLDEVNYEKITDVIDKLTKNIQLLSGGDTEKISHKVEGFNFIRNDGATNNSPNSETADSVGLPPRQED